MMSLDERVALLRTIGFFASAPPEALPQVAAVLEPLHVPSGTAIFHKGELGDSLYIIVSGRLQIHDGELILDELSAGDVVGELAVLDAEQRSASATALDDASLLRLCQSSLHELLAEHSKVALGFLRVLGRRLRSRVSDLAADYAYLKLVAQITGAAQAIESGSYRPEQLDEVAHRDDALGGLARVFQHMAAEVIARERLLRHQVQELRIEIDKVRQRSQVHEITASDYFRQLQERAGALRADFDAEG
jgi:CRP/FNR family cyclic AMP-dependent transcriptional regulator